MALLRIKDLCSKLNEDYFAIRRLLISKKIHGVKIGGIWMIDDSQIENCIKVLESKKGGREDALIKEINGMLTLRQASDFSNISIRGIRALISSGRINGYGDKSSILIKKDDLEKFLNEVKVKHE